MAVPAALRFWVFGRPDHRLRRVPAGRSLAGTELSGPGLPRWRPPSGGLSSAYFARGPDAATHCLLLRVRRLGEAHQPPPLLVIELEAQREHGFPEPELMSSVEHRILVVGALQVVVGNA